ncbi:MAG: hypothetical protein WCN87_00720 [Chlamydiota bacterium]
MNLRSGGCSVRGGKGWRGWLAITAAAIISIVMTFPFLYINPSLSSSSIGIVTPIMSLLGVWVGSALSMIFTGTQPHEASVAANIERTHMEILAKNFNAAAGELMQLYFSSSRAEKELAVALSTQIEPLRIRKDYRSIVLEKDTESEVLDRLEDAVEYIKFCEKNLPETAFFYMSDLSEYIAILKRTPTSLDVLNV